jgi:uncharacterized protein YjbI with pentapeptide repeats
MAIPQLVIRGEVRGPACDAALAGQHVLLEDAHVENVVLEDIVVASFIAFRTTLVGCRFTRCSTEGTRGLGDGRTVFTGCTFEQCDFRGEWFGGGRFEGCSFDLCRWNADTNVRTAEFVDCTFTGPVSGLVFFGRVPRSLRGGLSGKRRVNVFRGNDFSGAELHDVAFLGGITQRRSR